MHSLNRLLIRAFYFASRTIGARPAYRFSALFVAYGAVLAVSFAAAYVLRWDFSVPQVFIDQCVALLGPIVLCKILLLFSFGQFRSVLSYFGLHDLSCVVISMASTALIMLAIWFVSTVVAAPPRGVIMIDFMLSTGGLTAFRLSLRVIHYHARTWDRQMKGTQRRVGIIGAGDMGSALANDLLNKKSFGMRPVMFLDDDPRKWGHQLHGLPIYGPISRLPELVRHVGISEVIITMPGVGPKKMKDVIDLVQHAGLKPSIVPSFTQLATGDVRVDRFRSVELQDLLGRKPVSLDSEGIAELLRDRVVLVTGAGGSIGGEMCRQIAVRHPRRLLLVEQSEVQLFQIEQELIEQGFGGSIVPLIADIVDVSRMREIFGDYRPEIVFHAAAHKHVSMMERQPAEALKNNLLGTSIVAKTAQEFGVGRFVMISTDKAINPTSVMGASKRLAEHAILGAQARPGNTTAFMAVRFGNVLGSSGSVIPIFKHQIAAGGPVTVTHPDVTRYFMTIPEAVGLVLQAATMGKGGEVFVLDMGTPLKIIDVARHLIVLSGFRPEHDIEIKIVGLRPGEKLFEELQHRGENLAGTRHPRVMRLLGAPQAPEEVDVCIAELLEKSYSHNVDDLKRLMKKWVPEYTPHLESGMGPSAVGAQPAPVQIASSAGPVVNGALPSPVSASAPGPA